MPNEYPAASLEDASTTLGHAGAARRPHERGRRLRPQRRGSRRSRPRLVAAVDSRRRRGPRAALARRRRTTRRRATTCRASCEIATKHHVAVTASGRTLERRGRRGRARGGHRARPDGTRIGSSTSTRSRAPSASRPASSDRTWNAPSPRTGWTVGHFPQSFALATVGGWIACRGAGQYSNRYGKIEDIVRGLERRARQRRADRTRRTARRARPSARTSTQLFVGSEGTLGVITRATLVHASARRRANGAPPTASPTFDDGPRRLSTRSCSATRVRRYCASTTRPSRSGTSTSRACALIVLDEGDASWWTRRCASSPTSARRRQRSTPDARRDVARTPQRRRRARAPVGTRLRRRHDRGRRARGRRCRRCAARSSTALRRLPGITVASVHQSHAYLDGACLYFTFAGTTRGGRHRVLSSRVGVRQ